MISIWVERVWDSKFEMLGFRVWGSGFRVWVPGFKVLGLGLRTWGSWFEG